MDERESAAQPDPDDTWGVEGTWGVSKRRRPTGDSSTVPTSGSGVSGEGGDSQARDADAWGAPDADAPAPAWEPPGGDSQARDADAQAAGAQGWGSPPGGGYQASGAPGAGHQGYGVQGSGAQGSGAYEWGPPPGSGYGPLAQPQTEGMAIGALVCAIANFFLWFFVPAIVALVLAAQASRKIKRSGGALTGNGLVTAARIIAVVALVLNLIGAGFFVFAFVQGVREAGETPGPSGPREGTASEGPISAFQLQPGDCITGSVGGDVETVELVGCDQPHDAEVYLNFDLPDGGFPGEEGVRALAETRCLAEYQSFVGVPYEESQFDVQFLRPNADSWAKGDRAVTCMVIPLGPGPLTGSARDSGL